MISSWKRRSNRVVVTKVVECCDCIIEHNHHSDILAWLQRSHGCGVRDNCWDPLHCAMTFARKWRWPYYSPPVPSSLALSFLLTIFTPLSTALPLRAGAARRAAGTGSDGDGGSGGARGNWGSIPGGGTEGTAALTVGCECAVPGFAGSDGCAAAVCWAAVAGV